MNFLKTALFGALMMVTLTGCGCSTQKNYDNTVATETPSATHSATESVRDDAGNIIDDAGDIVEEAGDAVGDAADHVGNSIE